jgi:DNA-binding LytR/AlgR family response regulator
MKSQTTVNYLPHELLVQNNDNVFSVPYADVLTIVCDKPYIKLETIQHKFYIQQNLKSFCSNLPDYFQPCSKSVHVNLMHVSVIQKQNQGYILTIAGKTYPVSRRRVADLKAHFVRVRTNLQLYGVCAVCKTCNVTI